MRNEGGKEGSQLIFTVSIMGQALCEALYSDDLFGCLILPSMVDGVIPEEEAVSEFMRLVQCHSPFPYGNLS